MELLLSGAMALVAPYLSPHQVLLQTQPHSPSSQDTHTQAKDMWQWDRKDQIQNLIIKQSSRVSKLSSCAKRNRTVSQSNPILLSWVGRCVFHLPQPLHLSTSSTLLLLPSSCPVSNKQHVGIPCDWPQADQSHQHFHNQFPAPAWWHISPCWMSPSLVNVPGPQRTWAGAGLADPAVQRAELAKVHNLVFLNSPSEATQKGQDTTIFLLLVCGEHITLSW